MSLFAGNLKALILGYEGLLGSIGFDFKANAEKPDSLKAFLETKTTEATAAATSAAYAAILKDAGLTAATGKTAAETIKEALAAKDASLAVYTSGLTAAGVTPKPGKEGEALTAAHVQAAVEARASSKAAATVAATGHAPLDQKAASSEAPEDAAAIRAQMNATTDPVRKGELAAKLRKIRWTAGNN